MPLFSLFSGIISVSPSGAISGTELANSSVNGVVALYFVSEGEQVEMQEATCFSRLSFQPLMTLFPDAGEINASGNLRHELSFVFCRGRGGE
jgi:hypothetical protein